MVLALGVVTFCLLTLFGLISVGMNNNRLVREQSIGLNLCSQIELDLKATSPTNFISPLYGITIPAAGAVSSTTPNSANRKPIERPLATLSAGIPRI